ncbi:hypothetical protein EMIT0111MI5_10931 [Burkholderia sp. IT-111MI5]
MAAGAGAGRSAVPGDRARHAPAALTAGAAGATNENSPSFRVAKRRAVCTTWGQVRPPGRPRH